MAKSGGPRKPLVAEKRYTSKGRPPAAKGAGPTRRKPTNRRKSQRPARRHGFLVGAILGLWRFIWRLFFGITIRVVVVVALILGAATFYFYSQLPEVTALLDGRTRGSVTMLDRNDKVFAWRGETFGGQITASNVSPYLRLLFTLGERREKAIN